MPELRCQGSLLPAYKKLNRLSEHSASHRHFALARKFSGRLYGSIT
jgi:hypothetical protein